MASPYSTSNELNSFIEKRITQRIIRGNVQFTPIFSSVAVIQPENAAGTGDRSRVRMISGEDQFEMIVAGGIGNGGEIMP